MSEWHIEVVADETDRVLCSVDLSAKKVGDIDTVASADFIGVLLEGETKATGFPTRREAQNGRYTARRWPASDLARDPVETHFGHTSS